MIYTRHNRYFTVGQDVSVYENDEKLQKAVILVIPIYAYVHSGATVQASLNGNPFNDPWDSAQCGVAVATRKDVLNLCGGQRVTRKKINKMVKYLFELVEDWDHYITLNINDEDYIDYGDLLATTNEI